MPVNEVLDSLGAVGRHLIEQGKADIIGYVAAILVISAYSMQTMIPLRLVAICANCLFIAYGYLAPAYPQLLLHGILLPLNSVRLYQMMRLVSMVRVASDDNLSMDWVKSFTSTRACRAGETVFFKGDHADAMFYAVSGHYLLVEIGVEIGPGQVVGEMGWIAPDHRRTQTFKCVQDGELLVIDYSQLKQLYFQNPKFGLFFLKLISKRMFANEKKIEERLTQRLRRMHASDDGKGDPAERFAPSPPAKPSVRR